MTPPSSIPIQKMVEEIFTEKNISVDVLRLDTIHETVSGNKWFKLKYWLEDVAAKNYKTIATYGGAYSNHIVATAFACREKGFKSIGIIRGEEPSALSHTLKNAVAYGMKLYFLSRENFKNKTFNKDWNDDEVYEIAEGGYGKTGAKGASEILSYAPSLDSYSHIVCAAGTGTMLAGIINAALPHQQCIGISVMKNNFSLYDEIISLIDDDKKQNQFKLMHDFHFGGYAKKNDSLLKFMNDVYAKNGLPLDFVYTAKTYYAINQLANENYFNAGNKILMIHSGGLQGNNSLPPATLSFL